MQTTQLSQATGVHIERFLAKVSRWTQAPVLLPYFCPHSLETLIEYCPGHFSCCSPAGICWCAAAGSLACLPKEAPRGWGLHRATPCLKGRLGFVHYSRTWPEGHGLRCVLKSCTRCSCTRCSSSSRDGWLPVLHWYCYPLRVVRGS